MNVGNDGNFPISWTSRTSRTNSARFIVHFLTNLPQDTGQKGSIFGGEADRKSCTEIIKLYEEKTAGKKVKVEYIS
ncbi:hypothetical protein BC834DRAFT_975191 [Gloeopeniophorella convolvens]|nr:hypothetical protein BC834DRAFT_975191 [Gloeopeniophorella convolvens]